MQTERVKSTVKCEGSQVMIMNWVHFFFLMGNKTIFFLVHRRLMLIGLVHPVFMQSAFLWVF